MTATADPAVLAPGDYLLELEMIRAIRAIHFLSALTSAGLSDFLVDDGYRDVLPAQGTKVRLLARVNQPAQLSHVPGTLKWTLVHQLRLPREKNRGAPCPPPPRTLAMKVGQSYEHRLLTENRTFPTRERVWTSLRLLGHEPLKLVRLKNLVHLPRRPRDWSEWIAWTRWTEPSKIVQQHPLLVIEDTEEL